MLNCFDMMINIVGFNVKAENFKAITSWERSLNDVEYYSMIEVKGKLAVLEGRLVDHEEINFWILGDDGIWKTHIILDFPLIDHKNVCFCGQTYYDEEIIFVVKDNKFYYFCYDITTNSIHTCVESLYPIGKILQQ
ncbi:hypothetical protein H5410_010876 [Solanum commersonii]|uniref:F-box associated beta-propeller type 3 domain-containing protein n=1 Tax=Solanum commersonii TaxID=4109 RepID=A0A9J6ANE2_SOLCO|nr:hypothetical protein H5410_010876 [Solanum commersonii]